ncbi:hypothetical protein EJB05_30635, partial [Eragrostis curvula]
LGEDPILRRLSPTSPPSTIPRLAASPRLRRRHCRRLPELEEPQRRRFGPRRHRYYPSPDAPPLLRLILWSSDAPKPFPDVAEEPPPLLAIERRLPDLPEPARPPSHAFGNHSMKLKLTNGSLQPNNLRVKHQGCLDGVVLGEALVLLMFILGEYYLGDALS